MFFVYSKVWEDLSVKKTDGAPWAETSWESLGQEDQNIILKEIRICPKKKKKPNLSNRNVPKN